MPGQSRKSRNNLQTRDIQISKKLSWLLRHGADKEGLVLGPGGYANLQDVLQSRTMRSLQVTITEIAQIVETNEKQRFSLVQARQDTSVDSSRVEEPSSINTTSEPCEYLIRANQGHSIKIDNDGLLTRISLEVSSSIPDMVVHGTSQRAWQGIVITGGLKPMTRNHVHFAPGLPQTITPIRTVDDNQTAATESEISTSKAAVISGIRHSSSVLIYLNLEKAIGEGLEFWKSENGVILCDGGKDGLIPISCFEKVEELRPVARVLLKNGQIL